MSNKCGSRKFAAPGMPKWHVPVIAVEGEERREIYEARLALDWCRNNGSPHLKEGG